MTVPPGTPPATAPTQELLQAFETLDCASAGARPAAGATGTPDDWVAACDRQGVTKYLLKPAAVVGTDVKTATAGQPGAGGVTGSVTTGEWQVAVEFTAAGQDAFTRLTEVALGRQVAIVVDQVVQSAPEVRERIPGAATISSSFTQAEAEQLAAILRAGALPVGLVLSDVTSTVPPGFG